MNEPHRSPRPIHRPPTNTQAPTKHQHARTHNPPRALPTSCPLCPWTTTELNDNTHQLRDHLRHTHPHTPLTQLDITGLTEAGILACSTCNSTQALYTRPGDLRRHNTCSHPTCPERTHSNTDLVHTQYPTANPNQWNSTLQWLHQLNPEPPPFRTNLWHRLDAATKRAYHHTLGIIYNWILASTAPHDEPTAPSYQKSPTPFWKMLIIFDMMILHPRPSHLTPNKAVRQRLSAFHQP
jgi:hypothetical protein